jgi:glucose-6-phosphate isomerase
MSQKLTDTLAYKHLKTLEPPSLKKVLTPSRVQSYKVQASPLTFSYSSSLVDDDILSTLYSLAEEQDVITSYRSLLEGAISNKDENKQVLHHLTRNLETPSVFHDEYQRIADFTNRIHTHTVVGYSGKPFTDIVQIGIGGSKLGPEAIHKALETYSSISKKKCYLNAHFLGNSDPTGLTSLCEKLPIETTLFIFVSKSGTTPETISNLTLLDAILKQKQSSLSHIKDNLISVTCPQTDFDDSEKFRAVFYFQPSIGGRFSTTSASGAVVLMACFGEPIITAFLSGAHTIDMNALEKNPQDNCSLMAALISIWEHSILSYTTKAIIPYSSGLSLFPYFLQQLICESNGKQTDLNGNALTYHTSPIVFGEAGTNCQHSFFQLLHQGTHKTPVQFIAFKNTPFLSSSTEINLSSQLTQSSLIAQMTALSMGENNSDLTKHFYGNRPSTLLIAESYTPFSIGSLLAFYENMVMFEGFLLHINSFNQEGVQLGKKITTNLINNQSKDTLLNSFQDLFKS